MQSRLLFLFALLIGAYSYLILILGLVHYINRITIGFISILFTLLLLLIVLKHSSFLSDLLILIRKNISISILLLTAITVNLIGALGPELGFDALWYHLTLPKLYVQNGGIDFYSGSLMYYSVMPKLVDLLYVPAILFFDDQGAKLVHFGFGILTAVVTYKINRLYMNVKLSVLAAVIFYTNLVVGWMSITGYIDLGRAFFASFSILYFLIYLKSKKNLYLYISAILVGLEISTKLLGMSTLISLLFVHFLFNSKLDMYEIVKQSIKFCLIAIVIVLPWFLFSILNTGNPVYPFFTDLYANNLSLTSFNPIYILNNMLSLFAFSADPITPIYILAIPLIVIFYKNMPTHLRILLYLLIINILIWNFIPQKNARFIVPYLPLFSVLAVWVITRIKNSTIRKIYVSSIVFVIGFNIFYRGVANFKYLPVIFGQESKQDFLSKNLNFSFGDYIDYGNKVKNIVGNEKVLVYGIHNLYYIDFVYDHETWKSGDAYKFILTKSLVFKENYSLVYTDNITNTYLYEKIK